MIQLVVFLLIGAGLLVLLFVLARRAVPAEGSAKSLLEARQALDALQAWVPSAGVLERIVAKPDLEYVTRSTPPAVQRLFMRERRKVALSWVREVHKAVRTLRDFHLGQARFYARLSLVTEAELALHFATMLFACRVLQIALLLGGPYAAPRTMGRTAHAMARLCRVSEKSIAFLEPARVSASGNRPASGDPGVPMAD